MWLGALVLLQCGITGFVPGELRRHLRLWHEAGHFFPLAGLELQGWCVFAAEVLLPDLPEGRAEPLYAKGVDNGVDGRVAMSEQDGDVEEHQGLLAVGAEERDAVDDVEGQPADGKEKEDQSQRFGQIQLLVVVHVWI